MTEFPEHLLKRAQAARQKSAETPPEAPVAEAAQPSSEAAEASAGLKPLALTPCVAPVR